MTRLEILKAYATKVKSGKIIAGKYLILACERFLKDCKRKDIYFDEAEAVKWMTLTKKVLRHGKGKWKGQPIILTHFQQFLLLNILCWKVKRTNLRRFTKIYIQLARKNAKTTILAVICIGHLFFDINEDPEIIIGANDEKQARICVNMAGLIIEQSPDLAKKVRAGEIKIYRHKGEVLKVVYKGGSIEAISKNPETKDGSSPSLAGVDEFHEAKDDRLLNVLESGQGARHPFQIVITTAGFRKEGPCYSNLRRVAIEVLEGRLENDAHFVLICELDNEKEAHDPKMWIKTNPLIDDIETLRPFIADAYKTAKAEGGTKWVNFLTKNMNTWTDAPEVFIEDAVWMENYIHELSLEWFRDKEVYCGLDLSISTDLTSFVIIHEDDLGKLHLLPMFWLPESKLEDDRFDYVGAQMNGELNVCDGDVINHEDVAGTIIKVAEMCEVVSIGYDAYLFNKTILQLIEGASLPFSRVAQGFPGMWPPTDQFMKLVAERKINHGNNGLLRWNCSQTVLATNHEGFKKPTKEKGRNKIDGIVASIIAVHEWMRNDVEMMDVSSQLQ